MIPSPRPDTIGTRHPAQATSGARISETLSPTPPVECLSTTFEPSGCLKTSPLFIIARVSAEISIADIPQKKIAIANADIW